MKQRHRITARRRREDYWISQIMETVYNGGSMTYALLTVWANCICYKPQRATNTLCSSTATIYYFFLFPLYTIFIRVINGLAFFYRHLFSISLPDLPNQHCRHHYHYHYLMLEAGWPSLAGGSSADPFSIPLELDS